ncbi:MAG: radical SAM protein [Kosmotogaceae bacterium]
MKFAGWQKVSLVDYQEKITTTVFTSGCNFDCAYCHNAKLKKVIDNNITENEIFEYIRNHIAMIDALTVTGGEPTIWGEELISFFRRYKYNFGHKLLKIDTNGSKPDFLSKINDLVDYVAIDLKSLDYSLFSDITLDVIKESLEIVKTFNNYEIRVTAYPPYVKKEDFLSYKELLKGHKRVAIQQLTPVDHVKPYKKSVLDEFAKTIEPVVDDVIVK